MKFEIRRQQKLSVAEKEVHVLLRKKNNLAIKDQFDKESLQNILEKRFVPIVIQEAASSMRLVWFW